ncbi:DUF1403 family protein [Roseovarius ramblicola]|uniref:DUF1403 family protein n=1 Tax=Roseovarius ramblicola TaxID=2022336 RepID=A0ABV5I3P3_9RHOB
MPDAPAQLDLDPDRLPPVPEWMLGKKAEGIEDMAFFSGAALARLDLATARGALPLPLLRDRLALHAAEAGMIRAGRPERLPELRDTIHLLRPGDLPGPAGEVCLAWRRTVAHPLRAGALVRALAAPAADGLDALPTGGGGPPVTCAARVLEAALARGADSPPALILADAALARARGQAHLLPLLGTGLTRRDLRARGDDLRAACHRAVAAAAIRATRLAGELERRAARITDVAPTLRSRGADRAVAMFLARDAVAPAGLSAHMSGRAARRICDRLRHLGAVRELTGRDSFRLYGL